VELFDILLGAGDGKEGGRKPPGSVDASSILIFWNLNCDDHFWLFYETVWRWNDVKVVIRLAGHVYS
jgi:hypothetical protein